MKDLKSNPQFKNCGTLQEQILCQNQDSYFVTAVLTKTNLCTAANNAPAPFLAAQVSVFPFFNTLRRTLVADGLAHKEDGSTEAIMTCGCNLPSVYTALEIFFFLYCKLHTKQN